jgi:hypothetical protein
VTVTERLVANCAPQLERWPAAGGASPRRVRVEVTAPRQYARHTGHADLLRESVDGLVGESAPREFHL